MLHKAAIFFFIKQFIIYNCLFITVLKLKTMDNAPTFGNGRKFGILIRVGYGVPYGAPNLTNPLTAKLGELEKRFGVPFRMHAFYWQDDYNFKLPPGFSVCPLIDELYDFTTEVMRVISKEYRYVESYGISHFC